METKKALITWTHPVHLHKKLPVGIKYFPHIVREDDMKQMHWSIQFFITEANKNMQGIIELTMLIDNYETREFFKTLTPGKKFTLFEGGAEVATGYIVSDMQNIT